MGEMGNGEREGEDGGGGGIGGGQRKREVGGRDGMERERDGKWSGGEMGKVAEGGKRGQS